MFEVARHSYGTDDDIIFIKLNEPEMSMKETFIEISNRTWQGQHFDTGSIALLFYG